MKLVQISFRFEYTDVIEAILDECDVQDYIRYPMVEGKGSDGKHFGTQVFPGSFTVVQARVDNEEIEGLLKTLQAFRLEKKAHHHVRAMVIAVEDGLGF
ncbi:PG0541 family transporter-associated protein [Desulfonatronovibrio hydrogenovorans]|uniref:PG0541 family transporter-associated protein n=1 Tax=Desulfonatronovibrio hydrogenovorans TaxID=53245 RepID=UPI00048EDE86|nr:PG0541 family transporter-associated protein [Desulfonatronovibrio hydrogenovorans]